jgi:hypothetical protein
VVGELTAEFKDRTFGATSVIDAREYEGPVRDGRKVIYLDLVLSDPEGDTWPTEDVRAMRRLVTELARSLGITLSLAVSRQSQPRYRQIRG